MLCSVAGTAGWTVNSGSWELQDGPVAAWLVGPELMFSGPEKLGDGLCTIWLEVPGLARSEVGRDAVRRDKKVSRMNMHPHPMGRTGCHPSWGREIVAGSAP